LGTIFSQGYAGERVPDEDFLACNSSLRNLWVTVTRTDKPLRPNSEFLARNLQGALAYDVEFGFQTVQGGPLVPPSPPAPSSAMTIVALSLALIASLSVFVF
jgi:hypothetical protein